MDTLINKEPIPEGMSEIPILCTGNRLLIEYIPREATFKDSNLERPDTVVEPISKGIVKSVGPGLPGFPTLSKVGWTVHYFRHNAIRDYEVEGKKYDSINDNDVVFVL